MSTKQIKNKNMAYISIIAIVAIVGMFIMFFSTGTKVTTTEDTETLAGQAIEDSVLKGLGIEVPGDEYKEGNEEWKTIDITDYEEYASNELKQYKLTHDVGDKILLRKSTNGKLIPGEIIEIDPNDIIILHSTGGTANIEITGGPLFAEAQGQLYPCCNILTPSGSIYHIETNEGFPNAKIIETPNNYEKYAKWEIEKFIENNKINTQKYVIIRRSTNGKLMPGEIITINKDELDLKKDSGGNIISIRIDSYGKVEQCDHIWFYGHLAHKVK